MKKTIITILFSLTILFMGCSDSSDSGTSLLPINDTPANTNILVYNYGTQPGNFGPRSTSTAFCATQNPRTSEFKNVRALVSYSGDAIKDFPISVTGKVISNSDKVIANSWSDFVAGNLNMTIDAAGVGSSEFWTGTPTDGSYAGDASACNGWSTNSNTNSGITGDIHGTTSNWMDSGSPTTCDFSMHVLCVAY